MQRRWRILTHDSAKIERLASAVRVPPLIAQLLVARGLHDPDRALAFLDPKLSALRDPDSLPGIPQAAQRLHQALSEGKSITVYGDYDVDGMAATALLVQCLKLLGGKVNFYVPNRLEEGYGLSETALAALASQGTQLVVTVDCGIASPVQARAARQLGLDLIITDHHQFGAELPEATALVHPRLPGSAYPFGGLSGAGVAFKLAWAVCQQASQARRVSDGMREFLLQAVGLAALGTVADVVPLVDENRILVRHGLVSLKERPNPGLAALLRTTGLADKPRLGSEDLAFSIAPRLNAAGRLGQAQLGVELLTTTSPERASALADYLDQLNSSRQSLERSIYLQAHKQLKDQFDPEQDAAFVLAGRNWHAGVIGIVAGRLAEKYHRPVVVISLDDLGVKPGTGSGRSIRGFDLHQALEQCQSCLVGFGGHAAAAGLRIEERYLDEFRAQFCEYAATELAQTQLEPEIVIDAEAPLAAFSLAAVNQIEQLAPFGQENRRAVFCATGVRLGELPRRMGEGGHHLALRLVQHGVQFRAVAFGNGDWADQLTDLQQPLDIAFQPVINNFRGRAQVELHLSDWRVSVSAPQAEAVS